MKNIVLTGLLISLLGCSKAQMENNQPMNNESLKTFSYLALGDSYTIGTAIKSQDAYPYQLTDSIVNRLSDYETSDVKMIARNAWRTDDLIRAIKRDSLKEKYDLVSLLIGVNNQYQGIDFTIFEKDFNKLLDTCFVHAVKPERIFVLSIPNYGYTHFGNAKKGSITKELKRYNKYIEEMCLERGVAFYNITDISLEAETNEEYVAKDQLHPSAKQYSAWVKEILPLVLQQLEK